MTYDPGVSDSKLMNTGMVRRLVERIKNGVDKLSWYFAHDDDGERRKTVVDTAKHAERDTTAYPSMSITDLLKSNTDPISSVDKTYIPQMTQFSSLAYNFTAPAYVRWRFVVTGAEFKNHFALTSEGVCYLVPEPDLPIGESPRFWTSKIEGDFVTYEEIEPIVVEIQGIKIFGIPEDMFSDDDYIRIEMEVSWSRLRSILGDDELPEYFVYGDTVYGDEGFGYRSVSMGGFAGGNHAAAFNDGYANGNYSFAEGNAFAEEDYSHAEGNYTHAEGRCAHAEGLRTTASGNNAHAEGAWTHAYSSEQHVFGRTNHEDSDNVYVEIVGNGGPVNDNTGGLPHDARTLDWNGNEELAGALFVGGCSSNTGDTPYPVTRLNTDTWMLETYDRDSDEWVGIDVSSLNTPSIDAI